MKKPVCLLVLAVCALSLVAEPTGVWTAQGVDEKTTTAENWENSEIPSGIGLTFGAAGSRALLGATLSASGVTFVPAATGRQFTIANDASAPDGTKLQVGAAGIVVSGLSAGSAQTNVITAPIELTGATAPLGGSARAKDILRLQGPISSVGTVAVTASGPDKIYLEGQNDFTGTFKSTQGVRYIAGGSLGAAGNTATFSTSAGNSTLYFTGGTYDQTVTVDQTATINTYFQTESTNYVFNKLFTINNHSSTVMAFAQRYANVSFNKGLATDYGYQLNLYGYTGSSFTISNGNFNAYCNGGMMIYAYGAMSFNLWCPNSICARQTASMKLVGPVTFNTWVPLAFTTNSIYSSQFLPICFLKDPAGDDGVTLNLRGNDQVVGTLRTDISGYSASTKGKITSPSPATLYVNQTANKTFEPMFQDSANLWKGGASTLTLAGVSTTTGRLSVAEGTLAFSGSGAWSAATSVAVSGGVLQLDAASRINPKADYYLSGGKVDIAEGVTVEANQLFLPDGNGGWKTVGCGLYSAADFPDYISGSGLMRVKKPSGLILLLK